MVCFEQETGMMLYKSATRVGRSYFDNLVMSSLNTKNRMDLASDFIKIALSECRFDADNSGSNTEQFEYLNLSRCLAFLYPSTTIIKCKHFSEQVKAIKIALQVVKIRTKANDRMVKKEKLQPVEFTIEGKLVKKFSQCIRRQEEAVIESAIDTLGLGF